MLPATTSVTDPVPAGTIRNGISGVTASLNRPVGDPVEGIPLPWLAPFGTHLCEVASLGVGHPFSWNSAEAGPEWFKAWGKAGRSNATDTYMVPSPAGAPSMFGSALASTHAFAGGFLTRMPGVLTQLLEDGELLCGKKLLDVVAGRSPHGVKGWSQFPHPARVPSREESLKSRGLTEMEMLLAGRFLWDRGFTVHFVLKDIATGQVDRKMGMPPHLVDLGTMLNEAVRLRSGGVCYYPAPLWERMKALSTAPVKSVVVPVIATPGSCTWHGSLVGGCVGAVDEMPTGVTSRTRVEEKLWTMNHLWMLGHGYQSTWLSPLGTKAFITQELLAFLDEVATWETQGPDVDAFRLLLETQRRGLTKWVVWSGYGKGRFRIVTPFWHTAEDGGVTLTMRDGQLEKTVYFPPGVPSSGNANGSPPAEPLPRGVPVRRVQPAMIEGPVGRIRKDPEGIWRMPQTTGSPVVERGVLPVAGPWEGVTATATPFGEPIPDPGDDPDANLPDTEAIPPTVARIEHGVLVPVVRPNLLYENPPNAEGTQIQAGGEGLGSHCNGIQWRNAVRLGVCDCGRPLTWQAWRMLAQSWLNYHNANGGDDNGVAIPERFFIGNTDPGLDDDWDEEDEVDEEVIPEEPGRPDCPHCGEEWGWDEYQGGNCHNCEVRTDTADTEHAQLWEWGQWEEQYNT